MDFDDFRGQAPSQELSEIHDHTQRIQENTIFPVQKFEVSKNIAGSSADVMFGARLGPDFAYSQAAVGILFVFATNHEGRKYFARIDG